MPRQPGRPDGRYLAGPVYEKETILLAEVDLTEIEMERMTEKALAFANQALVILAEYDNEGPEFPQQDYFFCHQVLSAAGHPERAWPALQAACLLVEVRADKILDPDLRRSFLSKAGNRAIVEAYRMEQTAMVKKTSESR